MGPEVDNRGPAAGHGNDVARDGFEGGALACLGTDFDTDYGFVAFDFGDGFAGFDADA